MPMPRCISRVVPVLRLLALCVGVGFVTAALLPKGAAAPPGSGARGKFPSDPLPAGAKVRFGSRRLQDSSIRDGIFSPDTKLLATTGGYFDVRVWEVDTGKLIRTHEVRGEIHDLRWKPNGKLAA